MIVATTMGRVRSAAAAARDPNQDLKALHLDLSMELNIGLRVARGMGLPPAS
jgi:hypothetical protein